MIVSKTLECDQPKARECEDGVKVKLGQEIRVSLLHYIARDLF